MRRLMLSVFTLSWLGLFAGCATFDGGCGSSGCGSSGCGSAGHAFGGCRSGGFGAGGCGAGGCGAGGHGAGFGLGGHGDGTCLLHGICDCEIDDHCLTRAPWIRFTPVSLGTPIEAVPVPPKELPKVLPKDLPDELPNGKL